MSWHNEVYFRRELRSLGWMKTYKLLGADGKPYESTTPGILGGHRRNRGYGRLDCPSALLWIAKGYYVTHRVFFADEETAIAAGYRPCASCLKERYVLWKRALARARNREHALELYQRLIVDSGRGLLVPGVKD